MLEICNSYMSCWITRILICLEIDIRPPCDNTTMKMSDHFQAPFSGNLFCSSFNMRLHTLRELGHEQREVTLIDAEVSRIEEAEHHNHTGADIILVPRPSNDVNDPLRFPQWKKWAAFLNVLVFGFMTNAWVGGLFPAFYNLSLDFGINLASTSGLLTWCVLTASLSVGDPLSVTPHSADLCCSHSSGLLLLSILADDRSS